MRADWRCLIMAIGSTSALGNLFLIFFFLVVLWDGLPTSI